MCCKFAESLIKNSSKKCEMVQIPRQNGTNSPSKSVEMVQIPRFLLEQKTTYVPLVPIEQV